MKIELDCTGQPHAAGRRSFWSLSAGRATKTGWRKHTFHPSNFAFCKRFFSIEIGFKGFKHCARMLFCHSTVLRHAANSSVLREIETQASDEQDARRAAETGRVQAGSFFKFKNLLFR